MSNFSSKQHLTRAMSVPSILRDIVNSKTSHLYTYIILGTSGPTGKTWLYTQLKNREFNVFELSEDISGVVMYGDDKNHVITDMKDMKVTIILNKPLEVF